MIIKWDQTKRCVACAFIAHVSFEVSGETARLAGWPDDSLFECAFYVLTRSKNLKYPDFVFSVNKKIVTLKVIETHLNKTEERILSTYESFMSVSSLSL